MRCTGGGLNSGPTGSVIVRRRMHSISALAGAPAGASRRQPGHSVERGHLTRKARACSATVRKHLPRIRRGGRDPAMETVPSNAISHACSKPTFALRFVHFTKWSPSTTFQFWSVPLLASRASESPA